MNEVCKKCQCALDENAIPVGPWKFCAVCFSELSFTPASPKPSPQGASNREIDQQTSDVSNQFLQNLVQRDQSEKPVNICRICEEPSSDGRYIDVLGMRVCQSCYLNMLPRARAQSNEAEQAAKATPPPVQIKPVGIRSHKCSGCSRKITPKGAYETEAGLLCPECFYKAQQ